MVNRNGSQAICLFRLCQINSYVRECPHSVLLLLRQQSFL